MAAKREDERLTHMLWAAIHLWRAGLVPEAHNTVDHCVDYHRGVFFYNAGFYIPRKEVDAPLNQAV
jgi:hypothetical protein